MNNSSVKNAHVSWLMVLLSIHSILYWHHRPSSSFSFCNFLQSCHPCYCIQQRLNVPLWVLVLQSSFLVHKLIFLCLLVAHFSSMAGLHLAIYNLCICTLQLYEFFHIQVMQSVYSHQGPQHRENSRCPQYEQATQSFRVIGLNNFDDSQQRLNARSPQMTHV